MHTRQMLSSRRAHRPEAGARSAFLVLLTVLTWAVLPAAAHAAVQVVTPSALAGWQTQTSNAGTDPANTASVNFVNGPATPPLGEGSVQLAVGSDGGDAAAIRNPNYGGTLVSSLTALSYSTYATGGSGGQVPYIILSVDVDNDGDSDDLWFFEPVYQSATFCPSNPQPVVAQNVWQTWDALGGCWYSAQLGLAGSGPGANVVPLATLIAAAPNATIDNTNTGLGGLRIVAGFGQGAWDNHVGHVDAVRVATAASDTTFDFEPDVVHHQSLPVAVNLSTNFLLGDSLPTPSPFATFTYGARPQVPMMGDWDGDGTRTPGAYKNAVFHLNNENDGSPPDITFSFGDPRGFPVVGDYDGDGTEDVAVYRNGVWQVRLSTDDTYTFAFGTGNWPATVPVAGDWDGDGIDGVGTYTYSTATWALRNSPIGSGGADVTFVYGTPNASYPVPGDPNADGIDTVGVKTGTTWTLRNSNTAGPAEITFDFGGANDLPLTWWTIPVAG